MLLHVSLHLGLHIILSLTIPLMAPAGQTFQCMDKYCKHFQFGLEVKSLISSLFLLCLCRVSSAAACRKTWCTPVTVTETVSSTRSPGTAVSTVGCRGASLWGCRRSVSVWSADLAGRPPEAHLLCYADNLYQLKLDVHCPQEELHVLTKCVHILETIVTPSRTW